ncbi:MAG: hypothetical protein ACKO5K_11850 [Armatimonadota bacterium]
MKPESMAPSESNSVRIKRRLPLIALVVGLALASALPGLSGNGSCTECTPISCPPSAGPAPLVPKKQDGLGEAPRPSRPTIARR